ncbi:RlpA-like double-psi beta-barrel domain-containing protein [Hymenobacter latericus]|uniref:hypothetical protein n=1 Tax=Hymenobacter sp. YIM 151858-1 TaxID=2987688 RepID=UPI002227AC18|nr:hypothetical protein [Hymenobacter sp. YIM 151858-1]UYZ58000.1 hypothetical protein OIS50_13140 [Hymenobacter sp. YIM 151858-1]
MSIALFLLYLFFPSASDFAPRNLPTAPLAPRVVKVKPTPAPVAYQKPPRKLPTYRVTATVYMADARQTDSDPLITADNSRIPRRATSKIRWMALSRDLLDKWGGPFRFGDSVQVRGVSPELDGVYVVHDTMNRRFKHGIDLLVAKHEDIYGRWGNVRISPVPKRPVVIPQWQAG